MKNIFTLFLFISISSYANKGILKQKTFLASSFECATQDNRQICLAISQANDYESISQISLNALLSSKKEIKEFQNRVSITECCLIVNNGKSCEGLIPEAKKDVCSCRKRLNLSLQVGISCNK